jgi:glycosyltransferase involved in cell wall biosynthesis
MKIALVHSAYSRTLPSGENFVVESQAAALRSHGHEVLLLKAETDELSLKPFYKLRSMLRVSFGIGKSPYYNLLRFSPDIVLIHNLFPNYGSSWIRRLKKTQKNAKVLIIIHNFRHLCASGNLLRNGNHCEKCIVGSPINSLIHRCYRNSFLYTVPWYISQLFHVSKRNIFDTVDGVILLSKATVPYFSRQFAQNTNFFTLPNFVPMNSQLDLEFSPTLKNGKWVVVGRLSAEKGILKLVKNWPSELQLDIFGDGPELPNIQEIIKEKPNITLKGLVSGGDLEQLLPKYLGAIHCSLWVEIAPLTVLEFHRAGLPVIYTGNNFTPFEDEIRIEGFHLEKYESRYLFQACESILQNYREASINSHRTYLNFYSEDAWTLRFESLLRKIRLR